MLQTGVIIGLCQVDPVDFSAGIRLPRFQEAAEQEVVQVLVVEPHKGQLDARELAFGDIGFGGAEAKFADLLPFGVAGRAHANTGDLQDRCADVFMRRCLGSASRHARQRAACGHHSAGRGHAFQHVAAIDPAGAHEVVVKIEFHIGSSLKSGSGAAVKVALWSLADLYYQMLTRTLWHPDGGRKTKPTGGTVSALPLPVKRPSSAGQDDRQPEIAGLLLGVTKRDRVRMAEVTIRELRKSYGAVEVLHGVDVDIGDGQFVVLVGPSGCGKSTLLRMIAGLEGITSGTISIGDRVVNNLPPSQRDIALVFQNYALYPHETVASNMALSLRMRRMDKAEIARRVDRAADILGLTPYLGRYPRALSGGQRQRVAMGRAIVRDPQVFLFDEPLSNLDAKLRVQMRAEIRELHQRLSTTTVYVTHDQIEAMTMADKIVVMNAGNIEQVGTPLELYDNPVNRFVAGFIGSPSMNMISGVVRRESGVFVDMNGIRLAVPDTPELTEGRKVVFGIRPEHLELAETGIPVAVAVVEPTGSETHVISHFGSHDITAVFRERHAFRPGQEIHLQPMAGHIYVFDDQTGVRLA